MRLNMLQLFFPLRYLLILGLKQEAENSDEGLGRKTSAKMHKNKQPFWLSSGAGETNIRNLRDLDQKKGYRIESNILGQFRSRHLPKFEISGMEAKNLNRKPLKNRTGCSGCTSVKGTWYKLLALNWDLWRATRTKLSLTKIAIPP